MTEDEFVGWHHQLDGHELEQAPRVGDGQESLACCSPWGHKELDKTEQLNWLTAKSIALTIWTFVGKVMSLLFNRLSRFVIAFLPRSKCLLISWPKPWQDGSWDTGPPFSHVAGFPNKVASPSLLRREEEELGLSYTWLIIMVRGKQNNCPSMEKRLKNIWYIIQWSII